MEGRRVAADTPVGKSGTPVRVRARALWLPALILVGLVVLLGLAPISHLAADHLPRTPDDPIRIVSGTTRPGSSAMRNLPVGLPAGVTVATTQDVYPYAVTALGSAGAQALMALLSSSEILDPMGKSEDGSDAMYPYRYAALEPILDAAPPAALRNGATGLAAALIKLAGQPAADSTSIAGPAAYALLDRTRSSGGCDAQLDLLLLVASDWWSSLQKTLTDEYQRTVAACPNEPTPGWIVGQAQMRKQQMGSTSQPRPIRTNENTIAGLVVAVRTFQDLTRRFPRDTAAVTGLGDAYLRAGSRLLSSQPFTARRYLQLALEQYNQAAELGDAHDADLGRARALIGLGEARRAVDTAVPLVAGSPRPGAALEVLLEAQQEAHDFAGAEDVAQRLDRAGPAAFPTPALFYPTPYTALTPLSMGADTLAPLRVSLVQVGGAGGTVQDLSLIPQYRDDGQVTDTLVDCPSLAWRRDAILAGHAARALSDWPEEFYAARPNERRYPCSGFNTLRFIAQLAAQQPITAVAVSKDDLTDEWQNLLRWAGDLPGARNVISAWEAADGDRSGLPALRLGEVAFLQHDYNEAASQFGVAARRARLAKYNNDLSVEEAALNRGVALFAADRNAEAIAVLRPLKDLGTQGFAYQTTQMDADDAARFATVAYFAAEQLADYESKTGDLHAAVDDYRSALSWTERPDDLAAHSEVLYNNLAVAELGLENTDTAASEASKALRFDQMNPIFLMTAGFIADRAGKTADAANYDRRALLGDPGAFPAANDLGVELARLHDDGGAEAALRQAVGAAPNYALGWFNLGVLEGQRGPLHLAASQGAFARAFALDSTLKDRRHDLTIDGAVYRTNLDLSKPVPPRWSLADTQKVAPAATAGVLAVVLLAAGLAKSSGGGGNDLAKQWLEPLTTGLSRVKGPGWLQRPVWAVVATVVAFLLAYLRHSGSSTELVVYAIGVIALTGAAMYMRTAIAARANVAPTQHKSWFPGILFGVGTGAIGLPWAPLPVVKTSTESPRVHLAAPLTLGGLSALLFAESAWLNVPLTQSFAVAALVMAGATLVPIDPLDGANVGKAGVAAAAGVIGGAVLVALGII